MLNVADQRFHDSIVDAEDRVMGRTLFVITLAAAAVSAAGAGVILLGLDYFAVDAVLIALATLTLATVGAVLASRVPTNSIGLLLVVAALALGLETFGAGYGQRSAAVASGAWPGTAIAVWLYSNLLAIPVLIITLGIPLVYPDGRLLSPRWRWLVAAILFSAAFSLLENGFASRLIPDTTMENPFYIAGLAPVLRAIDVPDLGGGILFLGAMAAVAIRYRRGSAVERQQLKWLFAITAMSVTAWTAVILGTVAGAPVVVTVGWIAGLLGFAGFPVAIGIAVLRYRLYEIDRIVSRTIAWAFVTGVLIAVFAGGVVALQTALAGITQGETLAVAISTLVAAALFQPLRRRVQRAVDRRFDRASYDAKRTVDAFSERLRDEVSLEAVASDIQQTVKGSIKPTSFGLWLRPPSP
jgi:hypothetical protein